MTESMYPPSSPEIRHRRRELAPDIHKAFEAFGQTVHRPEIGGRQERCRSGEKRASSMPDSVTMQAPLHDPIASVLSSADDRIAYEMNGAPLSVVHAAAVRK